MRLYYELRSIMFGGKTMYSGKNFKHLNKDELKEKIAKLNHVITSGQTDAEIAQQAEKYLNPDKEYHRATQVQSIVQGAGSPMSPLRLAVDRDLRDTFQTLIISGTNFWPDKKPFERILKEHPNLEQLHTGEECSRVHNFLENYLNEDTPLAGTSKADHEHRHCSSHHVEDLISLMQHKSKFTDVTEALKSYQAKEQEITRNIEHCKQIILDETIDITEKLLLLHHLFSNMPNKLSTRELNRVIQGNGNFDSPLRLSIMHNLKEVYVFLARVVGPDLFKISMRSLNHSPQAIRDLMRDKADFDKLMLEVNTPLPTPAVSPFHGGKRQRSLSEYSMNSPALVGDGFFDISQIRSYPCMPPLDYSHSSSDNSAASSQQTSPVTEGYKVGNVLKRPNYRSISSSSEDHESPRKLSTAKHTTKSFARQLFTDEDTDSEMEIENKQASQDSSKSIILSFTAASHAAATSALVSSSSQKVTRVDTPRPSFSKR